MFVPFIGTAAAAVTASLGFFSARNMLQTSGMAGLVESGQQCMKQNRATLSVLQSSDSTPAAIETLKSLSRKELLEVFLSSSAPSDLSMMEGEWDGCLLDNNGWPMTPVSKFITNGLFGLGKPWNGKAFTKSNTIGINRFQPSQQSLEKMHKFDFSVDPSGLGNQPSLKLDYSNYNSPVSLWKTMKDEVRVINFSKNKKLNGRIMIGMGYMGWSGGRLNCQPFCLWKST